MYQLRTCTDEQTGYLKGLQVKVALYDFSIVHKSEKLSQYGSLSLPCDTYTFSENEVISQFAFYFTPTQVTGVMFTTSSGGRFEVGTKDMDGSESGFSTNEEFGLLGFFGSSDNERILSLGAIRMKYDCPYYQRVKMEEYWDDTVTILPSEPNEQPKNEQEVTTQQEQKEVVTVASQKEQEIALISAPAGFIVTIVLLTLFALFALFALVCYKRNRRKHR